MTDFFAAPNSWSRKQLKWAVTFQRGHDLPDQEREDGRVPVYAGGGITGWHKEPCATSPGIVTGRYGTIGEFHLVPTPYWPLNTALYSIDLHDNDPEYLRYLLEFLAPLFHVHAGKSAVPGVDRNDIHTIPVALPVREKQRRIADLLGRATRRTDGLIATKQRFLDLLAEKRKAIIATAVTRGLDQKVTLRDSGVPWLGEIPAHWSGMRIRHLISSLEQGWSPEAENREPTPDEWGVLKLNAVSQGIFDQTAAKTLLTRMEPRPDIEVRVGDVLITRANTPSLVGDACFVADTRSKLMLCDLIYRLRVQPERTDGRFLVSFLVTAGRVYPERTARGTSNSMVKLSQEHIKDWWVPVPPLDEQHAIVDHITRETAKLDAVRAATERTIALLKERRAALIAAAVTGQLDVGATA